MGQILSQRLNVVTAIRRMARVFTDHSKMIAFEPNFQSQFELFPNTTNQVVFKLRSFRPGKEKITVNIVDNFSKELVQGWTMMVNTNAVQHTRNIPVRAIVNRIEPLQPIEFTNRLGEAAVYEVETSNPEIIQPVEKYIKTEPNGRSYVSLRVLAQKNVGGFEAFIYLVESLGRISECWRFAVTIEY